MDLVSAYISSSHNTLINVINTAMNTIFINFESF